MLTVEFAKQAYQSLPIEEQQKFAQWFANQQQPEAKPTKRRKSKTSNVPTLEETRHLVFKAHGWT